MEVSEHQGRPLTQMLRLLLFSLRSSKKWAASWQTRAWPAPCQGLSVCQSCPALKPWATSPSLQAHGVKPWDGCGKATNTEGKKNGGSGVGPEQGLEENYTSQISQTGGEHQPLLNACSSCSKPVLEVFQYLNHGSQNMTMDQIWHMLFLWWAFSQLLSSCFFWLFPLFYTDKQTLCTTDLEYLHLSLNMKF